MEKSVPDSDPVVTAGLAADAPLPATAEALFAEMVDLQKSMNADFARIEAATKVKTKYCAWREVSVKFIEFLLLLYSQTWVSSTRPRWLHTSDAPAELLLGAPRLPGLFRSKSTTLKWMHLLF